MKIMTGTYPKVRFTSLQNGNSTLSAATRRDCGQALVELALTLPLLLLLVIGAAELGRMAYAAIEVANAARAGVAYGAQSHITASDDAGMQQAALDDGANFAAGALTATPTHFCACSDGSGSTCSGGDCSSSRLIEYVQVNTQATVHTMFDYPGIPAAVTLHGQAIMQVEQ